MTEYILTVIDKSDVPILLHFLVFLHSQYIALTDTKTASYDNIITDTTAIGVSKGKNANYLKIIL